MHLSQDKEELRRSMLERIKEIPDHLRVAESRSLSKQLLKHIPETAVVCAYYPLKTEPDITPLITELLEREQRTYLPVFDDQKLAFRRIEHFDSLVKGPLNIPEPPVDHEELDVRQPDIIVLVPGRAFDGNGNRLGKGAGGYDHWIRKRRTDGDDVSAWGVCLERQLVREVPVEEWDQRMNKVCTARSFIDIEQ